MSGNLIDLSQPNVRVPDPVALDTNVVIAFFQQFFPGQVPQHVMRARAFFQHLLNANQQALLTPTAYGELVHVAVRKRYERFLMGRHRALTLHHGVPIARWTDLYKVDATILQRYARSLTWLRQGLVANNVVIAGPEDLDFQAYPSALPYGEELIDRMVRYGLDASDTLITMEASRLGVDAIVTMDRDMERALVDFDVYTWL
jgi:predicted nucleic acid-binding protein